MVNGLADCLQEANLAQYTHNFLQLGICSLDSLSSLTIQEYSQFGITSLADKKRLFRLIHIVKRVKSDKRKSPEQQAGGNQRKKDVYQQQGNDSQSRPQRDNPKTEVSLPRSTSDVQETSATGDLETSVRDNSSGPKTKRTDSLLSVARKELKKGALSPGTLRKLETTGGILFVKPTTTSPKASSAIRLKRNARKKLPLRESLSDSEITDSDFTDNTAIAISGTDFRAPQLLKSFIEVIDHGNSALYNYGIPGRELRTPSHRPYGMPLGGNSDDTERIKVCVRKRPLNKKEERDNEVDCVQTEGRGTVVMNEAKVAVDLTKFMQVHKYHFDEVFGEASTNEDVYARTAKPLISTMFNRGKATCFAYGQTGAGKTHTMLGNGGIKGLYLLAAEDIFDTLETAKQSGNELGVWTSYFEIYCGQLFDLLNDRQRVHAREDSQHRVCIAGIREVQVSGPQTLMQVVDQGNRLRSKGVSGVNVDSSRSHAILQLQVQDGGRRKLGRFSFIDLAGSERACDTVDPDRVTRYEGAEINTSLLALKECIRALDQEQRHTPFRQSKLTQVLRDSFLGHSKTCMIANIAPNSSAVDHTLNTLRYADRVKELKKETSPRLSPYPSTPNTFSPATTSTPLKMSSKQTQPQKGQATAPNQRPKATTPGSASSHQSASAVKKINPVRKVSSEKVSVKPVSQQSDSRSSRKPEEAREGETNTRRSISQEVDKLSKKKAEAPIGKAMPKIADAKTLPQESARKSPAAKKALNVTFESPKTTTETPSKRSEEVRTQTKEAFLQGNVLPVWYPPEKVDHPKAPTMTLGEAWEIDNPRYARKPTMPALPPRANSPPQQDKRELTTELITQSKTLNIDAKHPLRESQFSNSEQYLADQESGFSADDEMTDNWSRRNGSRTLKHSHSETSCSTDTNSTIELLAEIDYALRNSLVSPLSDNDNRDVDEYPIFTASQSRMDETTMRGKRYRTQTETQPKLCPEHSGVPSASDDLDTLRNKWTSKEQVTAQHTMSLHPEIRINKSPDSMSTDSLQDIEAERLLTNQRLRSIKQHTATTKSNQGKTINWTDPSLIQEDPGSSFRSKLTVQGIESLPSPRDVQRVTPLSATQESQEAGSRDQSMDTTSSRREPYEKNVENPSGVIVSTSFHDYLASAEPCQSDQSGSLIGHVAGAEAIRPAPIGQTYIGSVGNSKTPFRSRVNRGLSPNHSTGLHSPVTVEVLRKEARSSAFSPIPGTPKSSPSPSISSKSTPNKAFLKESLAGRVHPGQTQLDLTPKPSPVAREKIVAQHQQDASQQVSQSPLSQDAMHNPRDSSIPGNTSSSGQAGGIVPRLQLASVMTGDSKDVRRALLSPRQNSAIEKAKELLVSAHAEQIDELERLCEREWRLIKQLHTGEKGLSEYLRYAKDLMASKLRCIDTFQDQLSTFSRCSTPDVSPRSRSPMEAW